MYRLMSSSEIIQTEVIQLESNNNERYQKKNNQIPSIENRKAKKNPTLPCYTIAVD